MATMGPRLVALAMPTLRIRFVSGKGLDSKLIEWYSRCEWSHVELLVQTRELGADETFGAQLQGGLKWRKVTDECYRRARAVEVWEIPITDAQAQMVYQLTSAAWGASYDWSAIVSFVLGPRLRLHLDGAYTCSGFVAGVLGALQLAVIDRPIEDYEPAHVRMIVPQVKGARKLI